MVEVSFTVNPRVRRIAAHSPDQLPLWEYYRQVFWGRGVDLPEDGLEAAMQQVTLDAVELPAGEKAFLSLQLPAGFVIVLEPVTHAAQFINVTGEPTQERQNLTLVYNNLRAPTGEMTLRPGPIRLSLENRTAVRALPTVWVVDDKFVATVGKRRPFLTAKRLLSNQTFRDIYRTDTLDVDQRLKITSLTFLFTDLKGSTELYERVGDLVAFDLVREHFRTLNEIVAAEGGAVVKTIGDAVMATFLTPDHALAAALRMREAMRKLNDTHGREDLLLKIGIHEGPLPGGEPERAAGLFRPDREHRLARAGPGPDALDPGDGAGDRQSQERRGARQQRPEAAGAEPSPARRRRRDGGLRDPLRLRRRSGSA